MYLFDSGAKASILSKDKIDNLFPKKSALKTNQNSGYGDSAINAHGISNFEITSGSLSFRNDFHVAHGISLIGSIF